MRRAKRRNIRECLIVSVKFMLKKVFLAGIGFAY